MPQKQESKKDRILEVVDSSYQRSKAELEEDMSIDKTPDRAAKALTQTVNVRRLKSPRSKAASARSDKRKRP